MKKLIVGLDSYTWALELSGTIIKNPDMFDLIITYIDDTTPILECNKLCRDAIYVQRRYDLFRLGKELGLKKVLNLDLDKGNLNIEKLIVQLQLYIGVSGVQEIWYQYDPILYEIFTQMKKSLKINTISFGESLTSSTLIYLDNTEWGKKQKLLPLMVGIDKEVHCSRYEVSYG